jgi:site-specific DNA recombinase
VPETNIFQDDYTGTRLNRPQFTTLLDLVHQRLVQAVIVYDPDRLSRKLAHQLLLSEEFEQAGVALHIVTMPASDKTPETQLLSNVRGIIAEYERSKILERTRRGLDGRAKVGFVPGGTAPWGIPTSSMRVWEGTMRYVRRKLHWCSGFFGRMWGTASP